ncbi:MAG TPA: hypothetical protein VGS41_09405, partial [Chthonomonadales bacterium]|nr:hypothetical protein [Chthonomonadales bacterium]
ITGSSSFTFFQFQQDLVGPTPNEDTGGFADYDTLGVDANALYIGVNEFESNGGFDTTGFVVNKADLLSNSLLVTAFRGLTGGQTAGPYTPQGVDNDDPAATQGYFIGVDIAQFGLLQLRRISTPGGTPTISGNIPLTVPSTTNPINVPSKGASIRLDAIDERLFLARINKDPNGVAHLWTAHSFEVNSSGVASSSGGRDGSRWYDITNLSSTPTLNQSGTLFDSSSVAPRNFWFPSITMSGQGHAALGSSVADTNEFADVAVAGRLFSDTLGAIQSPTTAVTSSFAYTANVTNPQRWGDYSNTVVDPADNMTFWSFQEWCVSTGNWGVQAIQLLAPPPAAPTSANPSTVTQGSSNVNVTITGTSSSGSGFYDPGAGFPNHISASVGGTGVTVNSVTYTDPTHVTLNISVASNASTGAQTVTITNPDGQSTTSASGILTIANSTAVSSVTLTPNSVIGPASSSGLVTLSATVSANTVVNLSSANSAATVPSTITVLSGTNSQTFNVTTSVVTTTTTGNITASLGSSSQSAGFTVNPDTVKSITFSSNPVTGGVKTTGTVTLNAAAPTGGIVVSISSSNTAVANPAVSSITILAGATTGKFTITTTAVSTKTAVTITATANGTPTTATLTVRTIPLASLTISPNSVVGGTSTTGTVTLTQNAAPGNIKVFLSSTNTAVAKPAVASVTILAGTKSATFTINTFTVASSTAVTIKAFADNTSKAATVTVTP